MEWWQIYLITRLDALSNFLIICGIVGLIGSACVCSFASIDLQYPSLKEKYERGKSRIKFITKMVIPSSIAALFLSIFIPSNRDISLIIAGHWATHNAEMQKLPDNVLKTLNGLLEKAQEEIK